MREIADAITNHIRETFPSLRVRTLFPDGILCDTAPASASPSNNSGPNVRIEVSPDHLVLFENFPSTSGGQAVALPWELPDLFDIVDDALGRLICN